MIDTANIPATNASPDSPLRNIATHLSEPVGWLRSEIDRLFDDLSGPGRRLFNFNSRKTLAPALDFVDDGKAYRLTAELPGLVEQDVEISIAEGLLSISGEKKGGEERKAKGFMLSERCYGAFQRQIQLPADVDPDGIKAHFRDGVLTVTLAKDEKTVSRTRQIAIEKA